jgi:hypothetical protein
MYTALRQTIRKRSRARLNEVKTELQRRIHETQAALFLFRFQMGGLWHRPLSRRRQNGRLHWDRMRRLVNRWLPLPSVCHPYPLSRMGVIT